MLGASIGVDQAFDEEWQSDSDAVENEHSHGDEMVVVLEFRVRVLRRVSRVPFNVASNEQNQYQRRQDPKRSIEVWTCCIFGLKAAVEWNQAAADALPNCLGANLKERCKRP